MRSQIKHSTKMLSLNKNASELLRSSTMRAFQLISALLLLQFLTACDQAPTTLDEEPFLETSSDLPLSLEINHFEFDFLSRQFFFSIQAKSSDEIQQVGVFISAPDFPRQWILLNDQGTEGDILIHDGSYDGNWLLPDSLPSYQDSLWTLEALVQDLQTELSEIQTLQPQRPAPPQILSAAHQDTLTLSATNLVLDTLVVEVSHPAGLDEIRDVTLMSLKPDGNYANSGQPIPLYDDGGQVVFLTYNGIDLTSGDKVAGDGIYSLLLVLSPTNLSGTYHWTINARTWLGIEAEPFIDSLVVLPAPGLVLPSRDLFNSKGVFQ